jgi:hypothetical protein
VAESVPGASPTGSCMDHFFIQTPKDEDPAENRAFGSNKTHY